MTAPSSDDAGKVYQFLAEYITAKNYAPSLHEIAKAVKAVNWGDLSLTGRMYRVTIALRTLQHAGKIRLISGGNGGRHSITLTALPTPQITRSTPPAEKASVKHAITKPGQIICVQCRNPVCEKSKWYCDLHLRLAREAAKRCLDKKRKAGICLQCDVPAGPVSRVFCESHRKKSLEATARCRARIAAKARRERSMDTYNRAHPHAKTFRSGPG